MSVDFFGKGMELLNKAVTADNSGQYEEAFKKYTSRFFQFSSKFSLNSPSIEYFMTGLKYSKNEKLNSVIKGKINEFLDRAEKIKKMMESKNDPKKEKGKGSKDTQDSKDSKNEKNPKKPLDEETLKLRAGLEDSILKEKPHVKWEDVAGLDQAKTALEEAVILPMKFPQMFTGKRKAWKGILLYGPPGTGKSYLAKAVASMTDSMFFSVSSSNLMSKWQGESEKLIRELFRMAEESKPSIVFIDEIDSICGKRSDDEHEATRRIKTEFLVQMQKIIDGDGVLVLAATNRPFDLDAAVRRRFEKRIYIPLPDAPARRVMFGMNVGKDIKIDNDLLEELTKRTEGYSGSDIAVVCRDVLMQPVREAMRATHWKKVPRPESIKTGPEIMLIPCAPSDPNAFPMNMMDVKPEELLIPQIKKDHWFNALEKNRPTVNMKELEMQEEFTRQFGQSGVSSLAVKLEHRPLPKMHDTLHQGKIHIIKPVIQISPLSSIQKLEPEIPPDFVLPPPELTPEEEENLHEKLMEFTHNTTIRLASDKLTQKQKKSNNDSLQLG